MNNFKVGDKARFNTPEGYVYCKVISDTDSLSYPILVEVTQQGAGYEEGHTLTFTKDGRWRVGVQPELELVEQCETIPSRQGEEQILQLDTPLTLQEITTPFTIVKLGEARLCLIGGEWVLSNGDTLDAGLYEVLKESAVTIVFDPLKQN